MAFSKLGQVIALGGRRCEGRPKAVCKRRGEEGEGDASHRARGHGRGWRFQARQRTAEVCRDDTEGGGA
eukprot:1327679-Pleurochrysis_carterae.AAC.1